MVRVPAARSDFFPSPNVQTGSGADLMTCLMVTKALALGVKRPGRETHNNFHLLARLRISGPVPPFTYIYSWRGQWFYDL